MKISQGESVKKIKLYPPTKSIEEIEEPLWIPTDNKNDYLDEYSTPIITIDITLTLKEPTNDRLISNFM